MGLKTLLVRNKLQGAERQAKKFHGLQRRVRSQLDELEAERRKGMEQAKYEARKAKLEARRHELIDKLKNVEERERHLRAELRTLEAAA
jgi:F0F1-type ATP synthase membrane subunit b/b'